MFIQTWGEVFTASLQGLWRGFIDFVPGLLIAIILFIIGWVLGSLLSKIISQIITSLKIDKFFQSIGTDELMQKSGMKLNIGNFVGEIVKWATIIVFFMASLSFLGLSDVTSFLGGTVLMYLGQVLIAVIVLVIGFMVANLVRQVVTAAVMAVNGPSAQLIGSIARYAVIIFAFAIALPKILVLDQNTFFGVLASFIQPIVWGAALALALAFGLGGKEAAARAIEKFRSHTSTNK